MLELSELQLLLEQKKLILVDVREKEEWDQGHCSLALLAPLSNLRKGILPSIDKHAQLAIYCKSGGRVKEAKEILDSDFAKVYALKYGYADLKAYGFETSK